MQAADLPAPRFTGMQSCASSGCHGGALQGQVQTWHTLDSHNAESSAILNTAQSRNIGRVLESAGVTTDTRCTECHAPFRSLPDAHFVPAALPKPEKSGMREMHSGVSCESCHGPAERWLLTHTRKEVPDDQLAALGLRDLRTLYGRANSCVACHLNLDPALIRAGHPELNFELDGQMRREPPHWQEIEDPWLGPRAWLSGQATALREMSWRLGQAPEDPALRSRWQGLRWLLRLAPGGASKFAGTGTLGSTQADADALARAASAKTWTGRETLQFMEKLTAQDAAFDDKATPPEEHFRRAQAVTLALDRLWANFKERGAASPEADKAIAGTATLVKANPAKFEYAQFAGALRLIKGEMKVAEASIENAIKGGGVKATAGR